MKKRFLTVLSILLALSFLLNIAVFAEKDPLEEPAGLEYEFPDDWSRPALVFAVENGVLKGDENHNLNPQANITRAEMAAVLVRLLGATETCDLSAYKDVESGAWYSKELACAVNAGIFSGVSATSMQPNAPISREQAVVVLSRAFGIADLNCTAYQQFSDSGSVSDYARDALSAMKAQGLISGYDDGTFRPKRLISRAEVAQLLFNLLDCIADKLSDIPASGRVLYRGSEKLPSSFRLDGTLIIGQAVNPRIIAFDWSVSGSVVLRSGKNTYADFSGLNVKRLVFAPLSGRGNSHAQEVYLWGGECSYFGSAASLVCLSGKQQATGDYSTTDVRGGQLTLNGKPGKVTCAANTSMTASTDAKEVTLRGNACSYTGSAASLICFGGTQQAVGDYGKTDLRSGSLTVTGNPGKVSCAADTHLTVNDGKAESIDINGKNVTLDGTGSAELITIKGEDYNITLPCDKLDDTWYQEYLIQKAYREEHDSALSVVKTQVVPCTVEKDTALYTYQGGGGWIRDLPKGTIVYNEYHPAGYWFYVRCEDGTYGWVPRWDCYIPDDPPGATDGSLDYSDAIKEGFVDLHGYSSKTNYLVWVSRYTQKVIVYTGSKGNWKVCKTFACSSGANNCPTPVSITEITLSGDHWNFDFYYVTNVTIFNGDIAFHSILYNYDGSIYDGTLGYPMSHGCIRMSFEGSAYMETLPLGTTVVVY